MGGCVLREEKKAEKRQELVGVCLDCFVEKGLTVATTKDLCKAAKLQNGGIYYYFSTKEEVVLACAEEAISRIEKAAFDIVFEDIRDIKSMMDHLGGLADKMSPTMRFLVSVCVSREYGEKIKPSLVRLAEDTLITRAGLRKSSAAPTKRLRRSFICRSSPSTII